MGIRPLNDNVLIKRVEEETKTAGGIYIPDNAAEKPQQGEVIAAGHGKLKEDGTRQALDVKQGHKVLFGKYAGTELKFDGDEFLMMKEADILGVIEG